MANVLYQYKTYKDNKPYVPIVKGTCSNCGSSVAYSQYGWDEECPNCGEDLNWIEHNSPEIPTPNHPIPIDTQQYIEELETKIKKLTKR